MKARWLVACSLGLVACSSVPAKVSHEHHHEVSGSITLYAEQYRVRGYDPDDPRLVRVLGALEAIHEHPIALRFHVETIPRYAGFLESLFDEELGKLPRIMAQWKKTDAARYRAMMAELRTIDFDYDGSLPEPTYEFGRDPGRLRIVLNSNRIEEKLVERILHHARNAWLGKRYLDLDPENVPPADRLAYLHALLAHGQVHFFRARQAQPDPEEPNPGRSEVTLRLLRLQAVSGKADPKLGRELTKALLEAGAQLRDTYENRPDFLEKVRPPSPWLDAERSFMAWALATRETLSAEQRYQLVQLLTVPRKGSPRALLEPRAFPGHRIAPFGRSLFAAWAKAGHPTAALESDEASDPAVRLTDFVLCPTAPTDRGFRTRRARNCRPYFYTESLNQAQEREALLALAVDTADPVVFREILLNLTDLSGSHYDFPGKVGIAAVLELWQRLEPNRTRFLEMARLLAVEIDASYDLREALYDQTVLYYRSRPADRGVLLFLLARIDGYSRTPVHWKRFAETYGDDITAGELARYLEQSYLAFEELHNLKDALPTSAASPASYSVGSVVASALRRYLDDPIVLGDSRSRGTVLGAIISTVAGLGDEPGLVQLQSELMRYVGNDPKRERELRHTLERLDAALERLRPSTRSN